MPFRNQSVPSGTEMIKTHIAVELRERILRGELRPGERISETQWAPRLGAAQASIREAINLLVAEGLVSKEPGRSARVTSLTEHDILQAYQVREVMEGLAAKLLTQNKSDLAELDESIAVMRCAAQDNELRRTIEADLTFHLRLCELSGNAFLAKQARLVLIPVFAFTMIRAIAMRSPVQAWLEGVRDHELILDAIRSGDPQFAEQATKHVIGKFVSVARAVWVAGDLPKRTS